jgi:hypothetical protein
MGDYRATPYNPAPRSVDTGARLAISRIEVPVNTVELVEQALALAERCGFLVRQDWLGGGASGTCELRGKKWIFLDLSLSPIEQLDIIAAALEGEDVPARMAVPPDIAHLLASRRAA